MGLLIHTVSLGIRWGRVGHGPFINLYEILSSNVWSLMLCFVIFMMLSKQNAQMSRYIVPILALLMIWLVFTPARDTYLPPTYNTIWLYFHVFSGKFFLGLLLLATGMAIFELVATKSTDRSISIPAIQLLSYRFLAFAFCFESLMLFFGAIWAQDAWGRYWSWDPLETWAFLTWLSLVFVLHWKTSHGHQKIYPVLVLACFVLAFLTFFGVPFISTAPHKGMI
ncbi:MAG: cytochrome c biogenesis protein CcsA [Gammaproteobacteria bacterium]|nr:cytochrome c biogenesis protein CcsA [Gammaproteobacteria bacterium]